jgi:L-iditol 2-dehydrogenase
MVNKMNGVVLHEPGVMRLERVDIPKVQAGELLVQVAACGVCGSDIPRMNFTGAHRHPIICGHEFSGHVVDKSEDVVDFDIGDLVTVPPLLPCRQCSACAEGSFSLCEDYDYFGSRRDGAYAEYVTVPSNNALVVPVGLDPRAAAMIDPCAIAAHAIWKTKLSTGHHVAVLGAGPIGLFAIQWAKLMGAEKILAVDVNQEKADMAIRAGATCAATSSDEAIALSGRGFDVVIESAGVPPTIALAVRLAARHGEAVFIGIPGSSVEYDKATFSHFLRREVKLMGSWNSFSAPFPGREWTESVRLLTEGSLEWKFMITHELPLCQVPETLVQLAERSVFSSKVLFLPALDKIASS